MFKQAALRLLLYTSPTTILQHAKNKFSFTNAHPFPQTQTPGTSCRVRKGTLYTVSHSGMTSRYLVRDTMWLVSAPASALTGPCVQPRWVLESGVVGIELGENAVLSLPRRSGKTGSNARGSPTSLPGAGAPAKRGMGYVDVQFRE